MKEKNNGLICSLISALLEWTNALMQNNNDVMERQTRPIYQYCMSIEFKIYSLCNISRNYFNQ